MLINIHKQGLYQFWYEESLLLLLYALLFRPTFSSWIWHSYFGYWTLHSSTKTEGGQRVQSPNHCEYNNKDVGIQITKYITSEQKSEIYSTIL